MLKSDAPFYLGINHTRSSVASSSNKSWFKSSALGVNKLKSLIKSMAEKAGFENRRMMIQILNDIDIPQTHIMQISGHRNVQSINNYSHFSQQQQENMSLILGSTESMSHESSYESVSGFSPKGRFRVRIRVWIRVGADFSVMVGVTGVFSQVKHFDS